MRMHLVITPLLCLFAAAAHAAPTVVKVGTVAPEGTPWEAQLVRLRKRVAKNKDVQLEFKLFLGGAKGDEKSMVRQCRDGRLEMIGVSTASLATVIPDLQTLELPFLFESNEEADFVLDSYLYEPLRQLLSEHGFVFYIFGENGWQNMGSKKGFIKGPSDLRGLKMRSQEAPVHLATWKALSASPIEMAVSEVLPALKTGLVDGFAQTALFTFAAGWHQGISHYTLSRHIYQPGIVAYSKKWFDTLPKNVQSELLANVADETRAGRAGVRQIEPGLIANFKAYGIGVYELTPQERAAFVKAVEGVHKEFAAQAAPGAKKLYQAIVDGKAAYQNMARKAGAK